MRYPRRRQLAKRPSWAATFGILTLPANGVAQTWGSGVSISGQPKSKIFAVSGLF
jgi:hypothetical protein